jgi:hypothetical protein
VLKIISFPGISTALFGVYGNAVTLGILIFLFAVVGGIVGLVQRCARSNLKSSACPTTGKTGGTLSRPFF